MPRPRRDGSHVATPPPGDGVVICCNGRFGEMWVKLSARMASSHRVGRLEQRRGAQEIEAYDAHPEVRDYDGAAATHPRAWRTTWRRARTRRGVLLLVDGVSSIGGMPFAFDEGRGCCVTAQKCLMSSPGLSFVAQRARGAASAAPLPTTTGTSPRSAGRSKARSRVPGTCWCMSFSGREGFDDHEEGRGCATVMGDGGYASARPCSGTRTAVSPTRNRSTTVTALTPPHFTPDRLAMASKRGILTAAALEHYQPTAFRIGHMGDIRPDDVEKTMAAVREIILEDRGGPQALRPGEP